MTTAFFLCAIYFLLKELGKFVFPWKSFARNFFRENYQSIKAAATTPELMESMTGLQRFCALDSIFFGIPYLIWSAAGLFSTQWLLFGALLCLGALTGVMLKRTNSAKAQISLIRLDSLVSVLILSFILSNHF